LVWGPSIDFILALFKVCTVNLAEIAHAFSGRAKPQSSYRRLQCFFQQFTLDETGVAQLIIHLAPVDERTWYLTLDRTNWTFGRHEINILMLGIAHRGMAVPLFWTLLSKAANSNTAERRDLIERFVACFGRTGIRALLADRKFVGGEWLIYLLKKPSADLSKPSFDRASISSAMSCSTSPTSLGSFNGY
jgi:hypothetical protein